VRVLSKSISSTSLFASPIPPPRFDEFSERVLGKWEGVSTVRKRIQDDDNETLETLPIEGEVEEVMRSCGGSVQGIRELCPFNNDKEDNDRPYHNRANDGFIYYDCGSYSSGPVDVKMSDNEKSTIFTSLAFSPRVGDAQKRRFYSYVKLDKLKNVQEIMSTCLQKKRYEMADQNDAGKTVWKQKVKMHLNSKPLDLDFKFMMEDLCSMPQINQPWMLQRVKWQRVHVESNPGTGENVTTTQNNALMGKGNGLIGWVYISDAASLDNENKHICEREGSQLIQVGAMCPETKEVKAIIRSYSKSGLLQGVIYQSGLL